MFNLFKSLKRIKRHQWRIIIVDLFMMWLLFINLGMILFDWIYTIPIPQQLFQQYLPQSHAWYRRHIHEPFFLIDMGFVAIYTIEFCLRWRAAVRANTYHRWYFFPFVHWYDAISLIPVGQLRGFRMLRVISILVRLQKLQIIDLTKTYLFSQIRWYFSIFTEEVSDRVVVHVIEGIQNEIREGSPVTDQITERVLLPQKHAIVNWLSHRIRNATKCAHEKHRQKHEEFLRDLIDKAVAENKEMGHLDFIPLLGPALSAEIGNAIADITQKVVDGYIAGLGSHEYELFIRNYTDTVFENLLLPDEDRQLNEIVQNTVVQSLEMIKEEVKVKNWQLEDLQRQARIEAERMMSTP